MKNHQQFTVKTAHRKDVSRPFDNFTAHNWRFNRLQLLFQPPTFYWCQFWSRPRLQLNVLEGSKCSITYTICPNSKNLLKFALRCSKK